MGDKTNISWTDHTYNPWYGCKKVSAGCRSCYMFRDMVRYGKDPNIVQRSKTTFRDPLKWERRLADLEEWELVFTCSWSDFFIEKADAWRDEVWEIIRQTPHLVYQICTKRPERIAKCLPSDWGNGYPNVWMGATTEDQQQARERVASLLKIPAAVHWLSVEPMLEAIDFTKLDSVFGIGQTYNTFQQGVNWVICGGESGPDFRAMDLDWARNLRDQCRAADVPFFLKQLGGLRPGGEAILDGVIWHEFPK